MELIDQNTKRIMEGCKERARESGLKFEDESLEYIVTNRDLLELSPKMMIPTLYDYWVHDIEILKGVGRYELYPSNPYETVLNTRPAISFYNDNNPDWLNVMIFYHVLAHIDFFQNNLYFRNTWDYDFTGQALSDKRLIAAYRREKGILVDYVIEFSRGMDNLVGYFNRLTELNKPPESIQLKLLDFYFDMFLQSIKKIKVSEYIKEVDRYNKALSEHNNKGEKYFLMEVAKKYPELEKLYEKSRSVKSANNMDIFQFITANSEFLNKEENKWMKPVISVIRKTSMFFQPQIRTKIMNEGWASYWHERLFMQDDRIHGHEVDFARVNAWVTALPQVGLNPYAIGLRMYKYIEEMADKGKLSFDFQRIRNIQERNDYDKKTGQGQDYIFDVRENYCDYTFIREFIDQDFVDKHKLFVTGKRLNQERMVWEYYVKSRKYNEYKNMLFDSLYHPPNIKIDQEKSKDSELCLIHHFEGKPLINEFIANTMIGVEYLWGAPVHLETSEPEEQPKPQSMFSFGMPQTKSPEDEIEEIKWKRVLYTMKDRKLTKKDL